MSETWLVRDVRDMTRESQRHDSWETSLISCMSHVSDMTRSDDRVRDVSHESCLMSNVSHESCLRLEWCASLTHVTDAHSYKRYGSVMSETWLVPGGHNIWVTWIVHMSNVTCVDKSCHTYEWSMPHIWIIHMCDMTHDSCHTYEWSILCHSYDRRDMDHLCQRLDSFMYEAWRIQMRDMAHH